MIEKNPQVTLDDEARGMTEDSMNSAFLDWLIALSVIGDDGKRYWYGCSPLILKHEKIDMCYHEFITQSGEVVQGCHRAGPGQPRRDPGMGQGRGHVHLSGRKRQSSDQRLRQYVHPLVEGLAEHHAARPRRAGSGVWFSTLA